MEKIKWKKAAYLLLAGILVIGGLTGCKSSASEETTIYGQVKSVDGKKITIALAEEPTNEKPSGEKPSGDSDSSDSKSEDSSNTDSSSADSSSTDSSSTDSSSADSADQPSGEKPSGGQEVTLTGEEKTITVSADTTYTSGGMGGGKMPSGDAPSGDAPSGDAPSGDSTDGNTPPEKPDDNSSNSNSTDSNSTDSSSTDSSTTDSSSTDSSTTDSSTEDSSATDSSTTEAPSDDAANGEKPEEQTTEATLDDVTEGSMVTVTMKGNTVVSIEIRGGMGGGSGASGSETGSIELTGAYEVDGTEETSDKKTVESTEENQNSVLVKNAGTLLFTNGTLKKSGDTSDNDESNFYAVNAIFAATTGSTATISDTTLSSDSEGSNAIFATGEGSVITADNVTINTTGNSSRGLDATYGGTVNATNVDITTKGAHCAPIATDRGEGTITVDKGTVSAAGDGSPCIYSTGDITASNVTGTATDSQAAVVEGKNSITLNNCDLTGAGLNGVMLYQSTSGDAAEGTSSFDVTDSKLTSTSDGAMFYITNTDAEATLTNTTLKFSSGILVNTAGNNTNNWGTEGSNGGNFTMTGVNQTLEGDITCDKISTVSLKLTKGSTYKGIINGENTGKEVTVELDKDSTLTVTGDSYVASIIDADEDCSNIISNGHTIYYDSSNDSNSWLDGKTITLSDGGKLTPME